MRMKAELDLEVHWAPMRPRNYLWACNTKFSDGWRILGFNLGRLIVRLWVRQKHPGMVQ